MTSETERQVDGILAAIEREPADKRRDRFFEELAKLPEYSRERSELEQLGRRRFAPGPYGES